jgi:hypothetical protein
MAALSAGGVFAGAFAADWRDLADRVPAAGEGGAAEEGAPKPG